MPNDAKNSRREANLRWLAKNPSYFKEYWKKYYAKNKLVMIAEVKEYKQKNIIKWQTYSKEYWVKNKHISHSRIRKYKGAWIDYFIEKYGEYPECMICKKQLFWESKKKEEIVHWDHRNGGKELIRHPPGVWIRYKQYNLKNKQIWESCDFGILCSICNIRLPTIDREFYFLEALKYVFGYDLYKLLFNNINKKGEIQ